MPSWFSKVFKANEGAAPEAAEEKKAVAPTPVVAEVPPNPETAGPDDDLPEDDFPKPRRVVNAPRVVEQDATSAFSDGIAIKAKQIRSSGAIVFMVDRPVFEGHSLVLPDRGEANAKSPLAAAIFDLGGVEGVTLHEMTVTVVPDGTGQANWEARAGEIGEQIRAHLKSGMPVVDPAVVENLPSSEEVRAGLQKIIDEDINPGIASHSGVITLTQVVGNTAYIKMGGGCQGCAASTITLRQGVETSFRNAVPGLGALLDETDHDAGVNPFFKELPVGMGG